MTPQMDIRFLSQFVPAFHDGDPQFATKALEAANLQILMKVYEVIAYHNFNALGEFLAPEVIFEIVGAEGSPLVGICQGKETVLKVVQQNFGVVQDQVPEIISVVAQGEMIMVLGREEGRFRPTGKKYNMYWVHQYRFQNGKIIHIREMFDTGGMIKVAQMD